MGRRRRSHHDVKPWPWLEDSREDRAKRVAHMYRTALENVARGRVDSNGLPYDAAGELHRINEMLISHGAFWAVPSWDPYDEEEWVTAADAAHYADVDPGTIRKWAERGHIRVDHDYDGTPLYQILELRQYGALRKQGRLRRSRREDRP